MVDARNAGLLNEYDMTNIVDFTNRLVEYVFRENQNAMREVSAVMGGQVLETYADRMIAEGMERGLEQRMERGLEQGRIQATIEMAREFGMPEEQLIERLMREFSMKREEAEKVLRM